MNISQAREFIDVMKSIDEKLGRIADALEKNVGKDVDFSGVVDEVVAAEKREPKPAVEEWDDERILRQFNKACLQDDRLAPVIIHSTRSIVRHSNIPGVVEIRIHNDLRNEVYVVNYDYINNRIDA